MEVGKITHSHSQPGGIDRTPPGTPKKGGKMLAVRVQMLDDTITMFQVQAKALGRVLFDQVCNQLHLLESDYFGLEYQESGGTKYWLDLEKPLSRQIGLSLVDTLVRFCVKFYTPDPSQLEEEFTRYLFCLQIKRDLSQGLLQCNNNTAALMASYIVQAECGDYVVEDYPDHRYLSSYKFVPNQDQELERRIMENHKKHSGQSPAEADLNLLETARRCELYGIKMHPAKDHEGVPLNLAVAHMGIVVFQNYSKINTFSWAKIRKISFKRKRFLVKLHPEGYGYYKDTVEFFFEGRNECKNFWKKCVENHGFFRCTMVKKVPRQKTRVLSRGSSFRYSGRTQKQIVDFVRENYVKRQTFQRSQSFRHSSSAHSSVANVGTSISAHPLLPLGDNAVVGTPASLSCGSMTLTSSPVHTADIHAGGSPSPPLTTSVSPGTSVTSSPQHFYPQETPYRRSDHQPSKVKHPHVRSHPAISPLHSPTDAAVAASNRSANLSNSINNSNNNNNNNNNSSVNNNNNNILDRNDVISSRHSSQSSEFPDFNEIYSNCYAFLRVSGKNIDNGISDNGTKTDIFNSPSNFLNSTSKSNESIGSLAKPLTGSDTSNVERYMWHRSTSCKELYHEENVITRTKKEEVLKKSADVLSFEMTVDSPIQRYDHSRRKCYSAVTSKNPSIDRTDVGVNEMRIYPSSYPGTTSSLSTESAEGEIDERIIEVLDIRYDSQEEMALSHDDVSHDSYELLERELDSYNDDPSVNKSSRVISENERTRSCSWGSDRGIVPLDFRSSENVVGSDCSMSWAHNFWSLEREKTSKNRSEIDFRSLKHNGQKTSKKVDNRWKIEGKGMEKAERAPELVDHDGRLFKRDTGMDEDIFEIRQTEEPIFCSKNFGHLELFGTAGQDFRLVMKSGGDRENIDMIERKKYQSRRKSLEADFPLNLEGKQIRVEDRRRIEKRREKRERDDRFHEGFNENEQNEWVRGLEKQPMNRRKSIEEKQTRGEEVTIQSSGKSNEYTNFQEIHFKKFDRVVSNQFGKYSEFLTQENTYDVLTQEKKVIDNYQKVCQVSKIAKELNKSESGFSKRKGISEISQENDRRKNIKNTSEVNELKECYEGKNSSSNDYLCLNISPKSSPKSGKAIVERTKSDPFNSIKNQRRSILMHQKSIDLTPQQSEETISDYDNEVALKKTSRSEHDIPYVLHKRHCMNGTAKNVDFSITKRDLKKAFNGKIMRPFQKEEKIGTQSKENKKAEDLLRGPTLGVTIPKQKHSSLRVADAKKAGVQIINLDMKSNKTQSNITEPKKSTKLLKSTLVKKALPPENKTANSKSIVRKEMKKVDSFERQAKVVCTRIKKDIGDIERKPKTEGELNDEIDESSKEPIYAEVCREKIIEEEELFTSESSIPPEPPKRTTSVFGEKTSDLGKKMNEKSFNVQKFTIWERGEAKRSIYAHKSNLDDLQETDEEKKTILPLQNEVSERTKDDGKKEFDQRISDETEKTNSSRGKQELPVVLQRREESLILFARTRLGLSEGSAFTPIIRQCRIGSPSTQRRTRSLDSPYVSVHSLPPVDAFSSKDDTVDGSEDYVVNSAIIRIKDFCKSETKGVSLEQKHKSNSVIDPPVSTESEVDSVFMEDSEVDNNFKQTIENQSKVEISLTEEKVLDGVRSKRLLSKIESIDFIDSEGDMDSSRQTEAVPIPSDRLVNLPESIRFPSVRQISGQTSEESADGWDQREVKVKRRTPRRSVGREEQDSLTKESVVWDSKDDEPPGDDVWEDGLVHGSKYEGSVVNVGLPAEYLKRGSCGQSIDDDNLSTPMKESSPEHWVSVDDLPEALEREEKLLRQQEKILREKILNEKLKRELNLDTIDVDESYCDYKVCHRRQKQDEEQVYSKENFKGHSLDTYELNEKKLRERGGNKNSSLDEHLLRDKPINSYLTIDAKEERVSYEDILKDSSYEEGVDYIQCKVVSNVAEIDQFGDNDEELEEFFVVLDENLQVGKDSRHVLWDVDDAFRETISNEEILMSVPEAFKDVEREIGKPEFKDSADLNVSIRKVEIRLNGAGGRGEKSEIDSKDKLISCQSLPEKLDLITGFESDEIVPTENSKLCLQDVKNSDEYKLGMGGEFGRLSPYDGSRRGSEGCRNCDIPEDTGRLSPYDNSSRRSSVDPRRLSASDDAGRLSPFNDSRRGSEDPRRLSTSEDSRKYSMSESVSEETRRRLSSTEETRRKRASLTKQCSVGAESLSDEIVSGIQECSSSFEHDEEKDVFESEPATVKSEAITVYSNDATNNFNKVLPQTQGSVSNHLEIEVSEDTSSGNELIEKKSQEQELNSVIHLAPPTSERELSRETEDSVDYGEGDFKDIRETVKERDISEGLICENETMKPNCHKFRSSFENSESLEGDELRYIDEKRGSTPEIIVGKSKESVAMSIVVVNEGISVLNKMTEQDRRLGEDVRTQSLPKKPAAAQPEIESYGNGQRHTLPKVNLISKPKPLTPKPVVDPVHRKLTKTVSNHKTNTSPTLTYKKLTNESMNTLKSSLDSSQESDIDKLSDLSLISHVQSQIARRNLSDTGKCLRRDDCESLGKENYERKTSSEEDGFVFSQRTSSEEREKTESSSFELKSSADELGIGEGGKWKEMKGEKRLALKSGLDANKTKKEGGVGVFKEKRSPDQEKRDSGEDGSSSSSAPVYPKRELSSTWKPFLLESSGSSSLEEGWLPPDENAHLADEEETSSTSNNQQDDSYHEDIDYPTGIGHPVLHMSSAEMMVGGYGSIYALSRTLSRISERSTSEQERSDLEDDITKPSSRSVSAEEESIMSSDHQPSLSSDPPSPKESSSRIPDLPIDRPSTSQCFLTSGDKRSVLEPFGDVIPPPVPEDDWPSPPSSSSIIDTPVVSHIETFYIEIHPEEARKVVVAAAPHNEGDSSSDENQTLQEESEFLHLSSDNVSASTTTTTQDGTVILSVRPKSGRTGSLSEDTSLMSSSDMSNPVAIKHRPNPNFETTEDHSDWLKNSNLHDQGGKVRFKHSIDDVADRQGVATQKQSPSRCVDSCRENCPNQDVSGGQKAKVPTKMKPPKLASPTGKTFGFFETPVSKVRSPISQRKFFEVGDKGGSGYSSLRSPTSFSETTSPKTFGRFFDSAKNQVSHDHRSTRSPTKLKVIQHGVCTPYYSNVADSAEKSYFGRYDTGSLERTKIQSSRKCCSYYSVPRTVPNEGDSSNSDGPPAPSPNTIPRASKKTKRRHRVAMDLVVRDGKIVAPPRTKATVVENSDSDRSSPREFTSREVRKKQSEV